MKKIYYIFLLFFILSNLYADYLENFNNKGTIIIRQFKNAPFPHKYRMNGLVYDNKYYTFKEHYNDSRVFIFIPKDFDSNENIDLFFYFHGWSGNIIDCIQNYKVLENFIKSNKNAIFIFSETVKNAKDSFAGKLEDDNGFKNLTDEIINYLYVNKFIKNNKTGNIILSGHSGGYNAISSILDKGGLSNKINEVYLLDGLYDDNLKFFNWINKGNKRFVSIITDQGNTKKNVNLMLDVLYKNNIKFYKKINNEISIKELLLNKITFLFTDHKHDDVVAEYLLQLLLTSNLNDIHLK